MDCLNCGDDQQLKDIMSQMDEYAAAAAALVDQPDIYTYNACTPMPDSSGSPVLSPPLFPPCPSSAFEGLINPYNLSRNLTELHRNINTSCADDSSNNSAASSQNLRSNSNEGIHDSASATKVLFKAAINPCAVQVRGAHDYFPSNSAYLSDQECGVNNYGVNNTAAASMAAMREMIFRVAAMQPISIDPDTIKRPKRRNVRISKDPQSVAARHRRERISDRIRILQRLVPGGTKMDTAAMLDEAIHYVKFLKRQVQALEAAAAAGAAGTSFRQFNHLNSNPTLNYSAFSTNSSYPTSAFFGAAPDSFNSNPVRVCNNNSLM